MLFDAGFRVGELPGMTLEDLYVDRGLIKVMGKGRKERIVPLGEQAQRALLIYLLSRRTNPKPEVCLTEQGRPSLWISTGSAARTKATIGSRRPLGISNPPPPASCTTEESGPHVEDLPPFSPVPRTTKESGPSALTWKRHRERRDRRRN
jgi:hypothetical protein